MAHDEPSDIASPDPPKGPSALAEAAGDGMGPEGPPPRVDEVDEAERAPAKAPFVFDPLAPYRGAFKRFFTVYRHTLGLLMGGLIAYVRGLPPARKRGLRSWYLRLAAVFFRPLVRRDLRDEPYPVQLRRRLEILGPTFIKLGQVLAIREDLLPPSVTGELSQLYDRLPPVPFEQVEAIIEASLGAPISRLFRHVDPEPLGSASIAQAHRAETLDGTRAVVKVIKPGIEEVIVSDLTLLDAVGRLLEWLIPRYQPRQIIEEFSAYTLRELDYTYEADHAEVFAANFQDEPGIVFPVIYRDLSAKNVLTMEFLDGFKPGAPAMAALPPEDRERLVGLGAQAIIRMLYKDGFFHADLHAGNLMILPGQTPEEPVRLGYIDLGMVGRFDETIRRRMLYYFYALVGGDVEGATRYLLSMATVGPGGDAQGFRRAVTDLSRRFLLRSATGEVSIAELILSSLSLGGRFRIFFPVEMTLMVKALVTFEGVGRMLDPHLNVPEVSERHVRSIFRDHVSPATLAREFRRSAPELLDLALQLPHLLGAGVKVAEESLSQRSRRSPLAGLRSGLLAGACIVGGTVAAVQGGPVLLWLGLFGLAGVLALFGK